MRWTITSYVEPPHVRESQSQASSKKNKKSVGIKEAQRIVEDDSSSDGSCEGEPLSLAEDVKRELAYRNASWHSMRLCRPPFMYGQCNRAMYLWCIYCDGCIHCLVGVECLPRRFKDRDEVKWVVQKWEKEVQAETILHPTPSMNVGGSSAFVASCAEA